MASRNLVFGHCEILPSKAGSFRLVETIKQPFYLEMPQRNHLGRQDWSEFDLLSFLPILIKHLRIFPVLYGIGTRVFIPFIPPDLTPTPGRRGLRLLRPPPPLLFANLPTQSQKLLPPPPSCAITLPSFPSFSHFWVCPRCRHVFPHLFFWRCHFLPPPCSPPL